MNFSHREKCTHTHTTDIQIHAERQHHQHTHTCILCRVNEQSARKLSTAFFVNL